MTAIVLILLGIGAEVVKANNWFAVPNIVSCVLFGLGGLLMIVNAFNYFSIKRQFKKFDRKSNW